MFNSYFDYLESIECENEKRILDGYETVEALPKHEAIKRGLVKEEEEEFVEFVPDPELFKECEEEEEEDFFMVFKPHHVQYTNTAHMALCNGRHDIKEAKDGAIFDVIQDPTDVKGLERYALKKLLDLDIRYLNLYVTGLTVALIASLNACKKLNIKVTLYHFDRDTGTYYKQNVE